MYCSPSQLRAEILPLLEYLAMPESIFGCHNWQNVLTCSGQSSETLLNILYCIEKAVTKNYPAQNVYSTKVEKPISTTTFDIPPTF